MLAGLDIDFEVQTIPDIDESFPKTLRSDEVPVYIARKKAEAYIPSMSADELLITADTIVWTFGEILGKPKDREDAISMLRKLSGRVHARRTLKGLVADLRKNKKNRRKDFSIR